MKNTKSTLFLSSSTFTIGTYPVKPLNLYCDLNDNILKKNIFFTLIQIEGK